MTNLSLERKASLKLKNISHKFICKVVFPMLSIPHCLVPAIKTWHYQFNHGYFSLCQGSAASSWGSPCWGRRAWARRSQAGPRSCPRTRNAASAAPRQTGGSFDCNLPFHESEMEWKWNVWCKFSTIHTSGFYTWELSVSEYLFLSSIGCLVDNIPPLKYQSEELLCTLDVQTTYPALSANLVTSVDDRPWDIM